MAERLLDAVGSTKPVKLVVRRGLPNPHTTHPRLDLFVGDNSPHPMGTFGCTVCHDGQGNATAFKWVSHTPNDTEEDPDQSTDWTRKHGWFDNHHWIFPMWPKRFAESGCLKCHHDVVELEPSEQFPDPPAAEAHARLSPDSQVRLLRLPRSERLRWPEQAGWSRSSLGAELLRRRHCNWAICSHRGWPIWSNSLPESEKLALRRTHGDGRRS